MKRSTVWTGERDGVRVTVVRENEDLSHEDVRYLTTELIKEEL
jgi:hypothetical protein